MVTFQPIYTLSIRRYYTLIILYIIHNIHGLMVYIDYNSMCIYKL